MEVHCFLLTDMLLICKPSTKKGGATVRVIRQPYLVDRLVVTELTRETPSLAVIYKNEFDMAIAAFILQNNDAKKLKVICNYKIICFTYLKLFLLFSSKKINFV